MVFNNVFLHSRGDKVMGIKGRRVHMIEELSETIISFQRGKSRELVLIVILTAPAFHLARLFKSINARWLLQNLLIEIIRRMFQILSIQRHHIKPNLIVKGILKSHIFILYICILFLNVFASQLFFININAFFGNNYECLVFISQPGCQGAFGADYWSS